MAKKVQLMTNTKEWQTVNGVEVLIDIPQEDLDPITDSNCVEIEGNRTLEETISQENMFTPEIVETKVSSKVGGVYHDNVVDGAYEEAILYGNTQVNLVESMTSDTKYIPHSFTSFQGNESKIGNFYSGRTNQVAPLVKGVTMVNLAQKTSVTIPEGNNGGAIKNVKPNTKYTLFLDFTVQNTQKGFSIHSFKDNTYLETSFIKIGMGEKVKLTFTTHEEANMIYIVNNNGYGGEIQLDDIMVIEGDVTDLNLPFFKGIRSVELSRPLTNLFTDDTSMSALYTGTGTNSGGTVTATSNNIQSWSGVAFTFTTLKPKTKYLVMWDSLTATQTSSSNTEVLIGVYYHDGTTTTRLGVINNNVSCPTSRSIVFDTGNYNVTQISIRVHATLTNSETGTTTVKGLRVFEWDDSLRTLDLQTIGYFSGTKYVSVRALETEGKNLYPYGDINFTPTQVQWHDAKGTNNMYGDIAQKSKCRFLLKKGTYKLSSDYNNRTNLGYMALVTDKEETMKDTTFTLEEDTYLTLRLQPLEANVPTTLTNIQIERGETATTYEAYQGRYYKPRETEEIILRSLPNGVCDTFNLQTGELVQNIGETVLDGSSDESWYYLQSTQNTLGYFRVIIQDMTINNDQGQIPTYFINDKHSIVHYNRLFLDKDVPNSILISSTYSTSALAQAIFIYHNSIGDMPSFKTWLQQNPITVQYELKEPIITKLQTYDRVYSGQTNALAKMGNNLSALTYYSSNYYVKVGNLSPVPAILEPITTIPYDVRLKPSTLYTVKYNRGGYSNSMKFDLGGSVVEKTNATDLGIVPEEFTVKTPVILSHEQLILSGTGYAHNFIIVEGDITGTELPYFEGMKDVKMPIVKNISRNLLNESSMRVFYENNIVIRTYDVFPCKPNTRYCFVSVGGETSCNWHVCKKDAHYERPENESVGITQYLGYSREIVTPQDCYYMCIHTGSNPTTDREVYDIKTAIYEGSFAECVNYGYEDYKENSVYAVQGEIPFSEDMFEQGTTARYVDYIGKTYQWMKENSMPSYDVRRLRLKELIKIEPNTKLVLQNTDNFMYAMGGYGADKLSLGTFDTSWVQNTTITIPQDVHYISFAIRKKDDTNITINDFNQTNFALLKPDKTIALRSLPNGVKDELNLLTGEYIQRVGEVVLDGSEEQQWSIGLSTNANLLDFYIHNIIPNALNNGDGISDKFNYVNGVWNGQVAGICVNIDKGISMMLPTKYVKTQDLQGCLEWLQQNPITIQYELAEPIISHVRLVSNNQEREVGVKLPNGVCNTYNPSTGITTVRVGKIVLDGSENWDIYDQAPSNLDYFRLPVPTMFTTGNMNADKEIECKYIVSDTFPTVGYYAIQKANSTINYSVISGMYSSSLGVQCLYVYYKPSADLAAFKAYLASNPITVWYELKYPQIQPDIVLPNGVHDEYNPETGVYTKRVGFIEFDGSEVWTAGVSNGLQQATNGAVDMYGAWTAQPLPNVRPASEEEYKIPGVCDTFSFKNAMLDQTNEEFYFISTSGRFNMNIARTKLTGSNISHLKTYLSQNPIKLWYELQTPITYQLTPYFGLPQPYAYEDGYLIHDSAYPETTLPPEFKYKLVANRTGQIVQNGRKLQEHTTRLSNLEALIIEATIESLFNRELQLFELELIDIQLIDLGE